MEETIAEAAPADLAAAVLEEINAYMGRHRISRAELADALPWQGARLRLTRRLNGQTPMTLNELGDIAEALGEPIYTFIR